MSKANFTAAVPRSRLIWVLADVVGLFSVILGSLSVNLVLSGPIFSRNLGQLLRCYRVLRFMFSGRNSYRASGLNLVIAAITFWNTGLP